MTEPKRPPTAQEFVLNQLRTAIVRGELAPGAPIRQDALAEKLGVSRVPLREALKILEGEGQVSYLPHRGYSVAELSVADLVEVYRIRQLLESEAVRIAVPQLTAVDEMEIRTALELTEAAGKSGDVTGMTAANREFHFRLFSAAQKPRLLRLIRLLWDNTDAYRAVYYGDAEHRADVAAEHQQIMRAIGQRDAELLVELLDQHRAHAVAALQQLLDQPR